ncbi:velvet factor-domain-containing protein [Mycena rosella]|uniref:Velvet factor-domain-containing protein n=1 Tax=Mycena rosella TaxID=1033263 RepID=A0AAD7BLE1_MYCRO|nr:velvet factor-domain-containing protein [Mycena rosella]
MSPSFIHPPRVLNRRALDPCPVVELCFTDRQSKQRVYIPIYQLNGYTLFTALVLVNSETTIAFASDGMTPALCGTVSSSPTPAPDPDTDPALPTIFFAFHDLGVRLAGSYRLRFTLSFCGGIEHTKCMVAFSAPFRVVGGEHYSGVQCATALTRMLAKHGVRVRIRENAHGTKTRARAEGKVEIKTARKGRDRIDATGTLAVLAPSTSPPPCADPWPDFLRAAAAVQDYANW